MMKRQDERNRLGRVIGTGLLATAVTAGAQDALDDIGMLEGLTVVGSSEAVWDLAGSAAYIESEQFRDRGYTDITQILSTVPGVYLRQEDGYGNFPNISMRGADGTRTSKVTVMEDGILTAPAPYSAPAAYYFPKSGRMSAIEVLKGSSQVRYGPQTTGGVLNFLSTPVPGEGGPNFYSRTTAGSDSTFFNHTWYGDTFETDWGRWGYVLEFHGQQSDGYRSYLGGISADSGFRFYEPMVKAFWEFEGNVKQRFEVKFGMTDFESDEGYLGLSEFDARANPDTRYAAGVFDNMDSKQYRSYLRYVLEPCDDVSFQSTLYWNNFMRNWYKLDHVSSTLNPAIDGRGRIASGSGRTSLHNALLDPALLAVLQGSATGSIGVKGNARYYDAYGWQNQGTWRFNTGSVSHELTGGFRAHYDRVFREQYVNVFNANGGSNFTPVSTGTPGDESNRLEEATALAFFIEDSIEIGQLTLRPGIRYEHVDYDVTDFNGAGLRTSDSVGVWGGGLGFNYDWNDCHSTYGGIYRGFALPGPNSYVNGGVEEEESLGYELGWRYRNGGLLVDTAAFFTDFDNLIGVDAGLGNGVNQNAGAAEVWGVESMITYDPLFDRGFGFNLPMYVSATWTSAELKERLLTGGEDDIYAGGQRGADIPYVPEWKLAAGIGYIAACWGVNLDANFTSHTYGTALNSPVPVTSARQGKVDALLTVDLSGYYEINDNWKLVGGLHNLFDERAVVTRLPEGPRTNLPRTWFAGVEATF
ncbi:TonB-dependent receptor [Haloferula helveola]|uniref:TonB-dependent receptor n=1 Tax=Haloferula helveola TaxID=490095 RepID=A0ABN6H5Y5_9BACT|nr:TonB-dependent receptor [Haloferula helveola]